MLKRISSIRRGRSTSAGVLRGRASRTRPRPPGAGVQRTLTLLATSTQERRNTVRILFYGQSITEQEWWKPCGFGKGPVPKGYTIRWHVVPRFTNSFEAPGKASDHGIEPAVTAVQGIPNTRHVLELRSQGVSGNTGQPVVLMRAIRIYRPPVPAAGS